MCLVEFEDTQYATKALTELYGRALSNSTKGGVRLSFSMSPPPVYLKTGTYLGKYPIPMACITYC
jgi:hypothetical protein